MSRIITGCSLAVISPYVHQLDWCRGILCRAWMMGPAGHRRHAAAISREKSRQNLPKSSLPVETEIITQIEPTRSYFYLPTECPTRCASSEARNNQYRTSFTSVRRILAESTTHWELLMVDTAIRRTTGRKPVHVPRRSAATTKLRMCLFFH